MRRFLLTLVALLVASQAAAQSHPVFFVTAPRQAIWAQMKADYEANTSNPATAGGQWYKQIKYNADCDCRYNDFGQWDAMMYQMSGTAAYAVSSYTRVMTHLAGVTDRNVIRANGMWWVVMYDWIYPGLDAGQRTALLGELNDFASNVDVYWSTRPGRGDSDQVLGEYMLIAMLNAATSDYNATVVTIFAKSHVGGYVSTYSGYVNPLGSMRNAISWYMERAVGGEWLESEAYNKETIIYLMGGVVIDEALGTSHFPEISSTWLEAAAARAIQMFTPDLKEVFQWGDEENPNDRRWFSRIPFLMMLSGLTQGSVPGKQIQQLLEHLRTNGEFLVADSSFQGFFVYNPYLDPGANTYTDQPRGSFADGMNLFNFRSGWGTTDSFLGAITNFSPLRVDHQGSMVGGFRLYKNREWIFDTPHTYAGLSNDPRGTNGVTVKGNGVYYYGPQEYADTPAYRFDYINDLAYMASVSGGSIVTDNYWGMPPVFAHEISRSIAYVPSLNAVVTFDRTNGDDPTAATGYYADLKTWMDSRPRKELFIHSPTSPSTTAPDYLEWPLAVNGTARVYNLLPAARTRTVVDAKVALAPGTAYYLRGNMYESEKLWFTIVSPSTENKWDTFLTVWSYYSGGTAPTATLVQDTTNKVDAALVTNGSASWLFAFNAIQGPDLLNPVGSGYKTYNPGNPAILEAVRIRDSSYSLTFTPVNATTKIALFDLDTGVEWTYKVNGGAAQDMTLDSSGSYVFDLATSGETTLEVLAGDVVPVSITTGTLPDGRVGTAYSQALTAANGIGAPYTWTVTVGTLPTDLSLSAGGTISGTPSVAESQTFTVQACDGDTNCGTRELVLLIKDVPAITTTSLDSGAVGAAYSENLATTGGAVPYVYTLTDGALPAGLSLSAAGVISGTPTTVETAIFEITVTDDSAETDTANLSIEVLQSLSGVSVSSMVGTTTAVIHFGVAGLANDDSCTVSLLDGEAVMQSSVSASGSASRSVSFSGLVADQTYGVSIVCGQVVADRTYIRTLVPISLGGTVDWKYTITPHARLVARGAAKVSVEYNVVGESVDTETASCATGCTLTLPLTSGSLYEIRHIWKTSGDAVVATSKVGTVAVP